MRRHWFAPAATLLCLIGVALSMGCGKGEKSTNPAVTALVLNSGNIVAGATFTHPFVKADAYAYHCSIHTNMTGIVVVSDSAPVADSLAIVDVPAGQFLFSPNSVTIHTGGRVLWTNSTTMTHTVTSD